MATIYVDSNAAGANDGTSWTDAYASLGSTTAAAAGDTVLVEYRHDETVTSFSWSWNNGTKASPIKIISADKDNSDAYRAGATINATANTSSNLGSTSCGSILFRGITFSTADEVNPGTQSDELMTLEECSLIFGANAETLVFSTPGNFRMVGGVLSQAAGDFRYIGLSDDVRAEFINVDMSGWTANSLVSPVVGFDHAFILFEGCDFGTDVDFLLSDPDAVGIYIARQCKVNTGFQTCNGAMTDLRGEVFIENCDDGIITVPALPIYEWKSAAGRVQTSVAKYRTGGADDGAQANEYSLTLTGNANTNRVIPLIGPPCARWVDGGSEITITGYVAHDAVGAGTSGALTSAEFGLMIFGPDSAASATARVDFNLTYAGFQETAADLTTDAGSTWNGTGVGTKQQVSYTYTPTIAGFVVVRPVLYINAAVQFDPAIEIS